MRIVTQAGFDYLKSSGRISISRDGAAMVKITLPEPGGSSVYEPIVIGKPGEQAYDWQNRWILVAVPSELTPTETSWLRQHDHD
jgi:hypothetical protein